MQQFRMDLLNKLLTSIINMHVPVNYKFPTYTGIILVPRLSHARTKIERKGESLGYFVM